MSDMSRREFARAGLATLGALAAGSVPAGSAAAGASKAMRGAFMILTTPFTASGNVDWEDLAREAAFVDQSGAHGIVWPQGSSGVANLTNLMKKRGVFKTMATRTGGAAA